MSHPCGCCGALNAIVNHCGCDPANQPTRATRCRECRGEVEEPARLAEWAGLCWGCFKNHAGRELVRATRRNRGRVDGG